MKRLSLASTMLIIIFIVTSISYADIDLCGEFLKHGKYDQAIETCSSKIHSTTSKEKLADLYYYRGRAYEQTGDLEKSFIDLSKAVELNYKLYPAHISLGMIYASKGHSDTAIREFTTALELKPEKLYFCAIYINRGNVYGTTGHFDKAIADYTKCIESRPSNSSLVAAYAMRGTAYGSKREFDLSIADCNKAIELDPNLFSAYNTRGLAWMNKKSYDRAIADYNESIRLNPLPVQKNAAHHAAVCD